MKNHSLITTLKSLTGNLSALDKSLPFILNIALFGAGAVLAYLAGNAAQKRLAITTAAP